MSQLIGWIRKYRIRQSHKRACLNLQRKSIQNRMLSCTTATKFRKLRKGSWGLWVCKPREAFIGSRHQRDRPWKSPLFRRGGVRSCPPPGHRRCLKRPNESTGRNMRRLLSKFRRKSGSTSLRIARQWTITRIPWEKLHTDLTLHCSHLLSRETLSAPAKSSWSRLNLKNSRPI